MPWVLAPVIGLVLAGGWIDLKRTEETHTAADAFWQAGKPVAIAVNGGRASLRAPAASPGSETLVIVSALSRERGPFSVEISAKPATGAAIPSLADVESARDGRLGQDALRSRQASDGARAAPDGVKEPGSPGGLAPAKERVFHMLVRDGDVYSPSNYLAVPAALRGVGRRIQVYVACQDLAAVRAESVRDIIQTFDDRVFALISSRFGPAPDVDGDGRFTVLLSSWLEHLGGGRYAVDGFVRVADMDRAFRAPLGNQCDMMYLSSALESGPYLRTVLAHEYMHAVLIGQKGRSSGQASGPPQEEEGWLDEAIAHLAEDCCGFSTSNIDYRVNAFLARPERYQLVVDDYYAADLFRSHGNRGSTYLFLKWCARTHGEELLPALVHSRLRGVRNLEESTGSSFAGLYRGWTLDLVQNELLAGATAKRDGKEGPACEPMGSHPAEWEPGGPCLARLSAGGSLRWTAAGTTSQFMIVDGSATGAIEIEVTGPAAAQLQVTAVPLGDDRPRLEVSAVKIRGASDEAFLRAQIKERHGVAVRLTHFSWEALAPSASRRGGVGCRGRLDAGEIEKILGGPLVPAAGELTSQPIRLAGAGTLDGPLIVKVVGADAKGRRVSAWAELDFGAPGQ